MSSLISIDTGINTALDAVLDIRLQRRKIYGDCFTESEDWELLAMMKEKMRRLESFIIKRTDSLYENEIDTLIDLVNWSCFLLEKKLKEGEP